MRIRPAPAHWFETYVPRDETVVSLKVLADTGMVELETDSRLSQPLNLKTVRSSVKEFRKFLVDYADYLPETITEIPGIAELPEQLAEKALEIMRTYSESVDNLLSRKLRLEAQKQNLLLLDECLNALPETSLDLTRLSHYSRFLYKGIFACPHDQHPEANICAAIEELIPGQEHNFFS